MALESNLSKLQVVLDALSQDHLGKAEFEANFKQVLKLIIEMQKRQNTAIQSLEQTYANMMNKMQGDHEMNYSELRKGVNELFVKGRLDEMDMGQKKQFNSLKAETLNLVSNRLKNADYLLEQKLRNADSKVASLKPLKGDVGPMPTKEKILEVVNPLIDEIKKDLRARLSLAGRGRVLAGPSADAVRVHEFTGDGTRSYVVPRHRTALLLIGTQAPFLYRSGSGNDFTTVNLILTINPALAELQSNQNFSFLYIK